MSFNKEESFAALDDDETLLDVLLLRLLLTLLLRLLLLLCDSFELESSSTFSGCFLRLCFRLVCCWNASKLARGVMPGNRGWRGFNEALRTDFILKLSSEEMTVSLSLISLFKISICFLSFKMALFSSICGSPCLLSLLFPILAVLSVLFGLVSFPSLTWLSLWTASSSLLLLI